MGLLHDIHSVSAESALAIFVIGAAALTMVLYIHRWLSKLAGHTIAPAVPSRHVP